MTDQCAILTTDDDDERTCNTAEHERTHDVNQTWMALPPHDSTGTNSERIYGVNQTRTALLSTSTTAQAQPSEEWAHELDNHARNHTTAAAPAIMPFNFICHCNHHNHEPTNSSSIVSSCIVYGRGLGEAPLLVHNINRARGSQPALLEEVVELASPKLPSSSLLCCKLLDETIRPSQQTRAEHRHDT